MYVSWTDHTAKITASMVKEVVCEKCETEYLYALERTETGTGTSLYGLDDAGAQARATERAQQNLQSALDNAFECVPCPNCGNYQAQMAEFLKRSHLKFYVAYGACFIIGAGMMLLLALMFSNIVIGAMGGICVVVGIGLIIYRMGEVAKFDANAGDAEPRIRFAREIAILKKDVLPAADADVAGAQPSQSRRQRGRRG